MMFSDNILPSLEKWTLQDGATCTDKAITLISGSKTYTSQLGSFLAYTPSQFEIYILFTGLIDPYVLGVFGRLELTYTNDTNDPECFQLFFIPQEQGTDFYAYTTVDLSGKDLSNIKLTLYNTTGTSILVKQLNMSPSTEISSITVDSEKIPGVWHMPNKVFNSSFGRFGENLIPDYWDTNGVVSTAYQAFGDYSLYLTAGQHCYQKAIVGNELLDGAKYPTLSTKYSFRFLGIGQVKIYVKSGTEIIPISSSTADSTDKDVSENVIACYFDIDELYWRASIDYLLLEPNTKVMQLCMEVVSGYVYVDGISGSPTSAAQYSVVFQDGPKTHNDLVQIRTSGQVNAEIGTIWFRSDV